MTDATEAVQLHVAAFFEGHPIERVEWLEGPIRTRVPNFQVVRAAPGPRIDLWTYLTVGCWDAAHDEAGHGLEFLLVAPAAEPSLAELLAMVSYYHAGPDSQRLDLGHTVPIGRPWLPGSACDHLLVSLPYIFGPDLEGCRWADGHARLLWLLPITERERAFKVERGLDALEARFEESGVGYADPTRSSVV
jgi:hypothetical protein